jgi:hypothetical protein
MAAATALIGFLVGTAGKVTGHFIHKADTKTNTNQAKELDKLEVERERRQDQRDRGEKVTYYTDPENKPAYKPINQGAMRGGRGRIR